MVLLVGEIFRLVVSVEVSRDQQSERQKSCWTLDGICLRPCSLVWVGLGDFCVIKRSSWTCKKCACANFERLSQCTCEYPNRCRIRCFDKTLYVTKHTIGTVQMDLIRTISHLLSLSFTLVKELLGKTLIRLAVCSVSHFIIKKVSRFWNK